MHDLIIVGGGAAAMSAAVYAFGKQLDAVMVYEKIGGKAGTRQHLQGQANEEYVAGAEAARALERQLAANAAQMICDRVTTISKHDGVFSVTTEQHSTLEGLAVLIATGASPVRLDAPGAAELLNQGLGYSATTHAHMVAGKPVAVVGATVRALRGAAELARSASHVYVVVPGEGELETPLGRALCQRPNVEVLEGYHVKAVVGPFNVAALVVERGEDHRRLRVNAAFVDLGLHPNSALVQQIAQTDAEGFVWVDERYATTLPGLFAAGDVTTSFGEQILIAIGDGARAALSAYDYILANTPIVIAAQ